MAGYTVVSLKLLIERAMRYGMPYVDEGTSHNQPRFRSSAAIVLTIDPHGQLLVLLVRKAFGPSTEPTRPGERFQVGLTDDRWRGAAGTARKYWGCWGTPGGTNHPAAMSNTWAAKRETREETCTPGLLMYRLLNSFNSSGTWIGVYFIPWDVAKTMVMGNRTRRQLLQSSKGEIAGLRWFSLYNVLNKTPEFHRGSKGLTDYCQRSFAELILKTRR